MTRTSSLRKLIVMVMCVAMLLSVLAINAFAAYPGAYATSLYQAGTYDTPQETLSMGDAAILNSDITLNSPETGKTTVVVYVQGMNVGPLRGHVIEMSLYYGSGLVPGTPGDYVTVTTDPDYGYPTKFTFVLDGIVTFSPVTLSAAFANSQLQVLVPALDPVHPSPVSADLVIFQ